MTSDDVLAQVDFGDRARAVMRALGGRGAVHLRGPRTAAARLFALADELADVQRETGAWLVVNDRLDVALAAGARGLQLTSRSLSVADARRLADELRVGASIHSATEARVAEREGADWVVAGNVFGTTTHPGEPGRGLSFAQTVRRESEMPCVGIGGIKPEHVGALLDAGFYGIAAISGIWGATDAERAAVEYLSAHDGHRASQ